jgi:hypothetical protein
MILKFAIMTSAFYLAAAVLLQIAWSLTVRWKGEALVYVTQWGLILLFGLVWLISISLAWYWLHHK